MQIELSKLVTGYWFGKEQPAINFIFKNQRHTSLAVNANSDIEIADAIFTDQPNTPIAVKTADCLPILLYSNDNWVAVIHAGWRGLQAGIIENTMQHSPTGKQVYAWLGPCISQANYEVGAELLDSFSGYSRLFQKTAHGKYLMSLQGIAKAKLYDCAVADLSVNSDCTYAMSSQYYSYRYNKATGRNITGIMFCS